MVPNAVPAVTELGCDVKPSLVAPTTAAGWELLVADHEPNTAVTVYE